MAKDTIANRIRALLDLQREQAAKRSRIYLATEVDEVGAIRDLAYELFGNRGFVETNAAEPGIFYVGCYTDGRPAPKEIDHARLPWCKKVLRGATHAELAAQAKVLGLKRGNGNLS